MLFNHGLEFPVVGIAGVLDAVHPRSTVFGNFEKEFLPEPLRNKGGLLKQSTRSTVEAGS